jgi:hypothetical protein
MMLKWCFEVTRGTTYHSQLGEKNIKHHLPQLVGGTALFVFVFF